MLIFNKIKRGMSYESAVKQLKEELEVMDTTFAKSKTFAKSNTKKVEDEPLPHNLNIKKEVKNGKRLRKRILPEL